MIPTTRLEPREHIVIRNVFRGRVQTVFPSIVVVDSPELVVTWLPLETPVLNGVTDPSAEHDGKQGHLSAEIMSAKQWIMAERNCHTSGTLRIKNPRLMWSLWVFWEPEMTEVRSWYINIDAPYKRTSIGFDTWDMFLASWSSPIARRCDTKMKMNSLRRSKREFSQRSRLRRLATPPLVPCKRSRKTASGSTTFGAIGGPTFSGRFHRSQRIGMRFNLVQPCESVDQWHAANYIHDSTSTVHEVEFGNV